MSKFSVLVLDDDEDNLMVLETALTIRGFHVKVARSCAEAATLLASGETFDALVSDLSLGDGNAIDLMTTLGERRPKFAVLVSGYGSPEDRQRSREAGFDAHLVKPVDLKKLDLTLRGALDGGGVPPAPTAPV